MTTAPENYYPAEYQGRTIYFCTEFCLDAFKADHDRFYIAHSKSAKNASPS
jgi:YHS domain-containing protein